MHNGLAPDISYLEGNQNYTNIYYKNGKKSLSSYTLLRHEKSLTHFIRINRSYLVNPEMIQEYSLIKSDPHVLLKCGKKIAIPRWRIKDFYVNEIEEAV